jgi:hypothetical protein
MNKNKSMIYELDEDEIFFDFAEFQSFEDIGFPTEGLSIEGCSSVAFLTLKPESLNVHINLILIDPYYDIVQISLFKSSKYFEFNKKGACY